MTKSQLFSLAHQIAQLRNVAFYGSYQKAFGAVLRELYAMGYQNGGRAFQVVEPSYKRNQFNPRTGEWMVPA